MDEFGWNGGMIGIACRILCVLMWIKQCWRGLIITPSAKAEGNEYCKRKKIVN